MDGWMYGCMYVCIYKSPPMLPTKFRVNWPFGSGEEANIDFQDDRHGGHLEFPIGTIFRAIFDHSDTSYQVSSLLAIRFREEANS